MFLLLSGKQEAMEEPDTARSGQFIFLVSAMLFTSVSKSVHSGFWHNTDSRSTEPLLTPHKINMKIKFKKAQNYICINGTASSSLLNVASLKFPRWQTSCRLLTLFSFDCKCRFCLWKTKQGISWKFIIKYGICTYQKIKQWK